MNRLVRPKEVEKALASLQASMDKFLPANPYAANEQNLWWPLSRWLVDLLYTARKDWVFAQMVRTEGGPRAGGVHLGHYCDALEAIFSDFGLRGICLIAGGLPEGKTATEAAVLALRRLQRRGLYPRRRKQFLYRDVRSELKRIRQRMSPAQMLFWPRGFYQYLRDEDYLFETGPWGFSREAINDLKVA